MPWPLVCALAVSLMGHGGLLAGLLRLAPERTGPEVRPTLDVLVTWMDMNAEPREAVAEPGLPRDVETAPAPVQERGPEPAQVPEGPEPAEPRTAAPERLPVHSAADRIAAEYAESNYWAQVRTEIARHLRWPGGPVRAALVEVELTVDGQGRVVDLQSRLKEGDVRFVARVERAVRQASPFLPPGGHVRTACLPVRFLTQNPQGE